MKTLITLFVLMGSLSAFSQGGNAKPEYEKSEDLKIQSTEVRHDANLQQLIWSIQVNGEAGNTLPSSAGNLNGAPVLGYVFPTSLKSTDVGFSETDGIVALALTSHPDFDDTPLWDENGDKNFANDGIIWHPHWVVLTSDDRVPGGLSVLQFNKEKDQVTLPPTNPGMPMYMDSPGFSVITKDDLITVIVPAFRMNGQTSFQFDAVTAYMEVNTEKKDFPMLGVYKVYDVASGDLSLPYTVSK